MTTIRQSAVIDAPPEEVWRVIADARNLPRWNPHIRSVHGAPDRPLQRGDHYWTEIRIVGVPTKVGAVVMEVEPPRSSVVKLFGPLEAIVHTWVKPIGRSRSRVEHEVSYTIRGGPLGSLIARAVRVIGAPTLLKRGIRAQKEQVELG